MELFLIRHAKTDWNDLGLWQGNTDVPLNETGFEQARKIAQRLSKQHVEVIYTSPLLRASQTALVISKTLNLPLFVDERLRECEISLWNGLTMQETLEKYRNEFIRWSTQPDAEINGVEPLQKVQNRILQFIEEIIKKPFGSVAVVSHALVLRTFICWVLKLPLKEHKNFKLDNASISLVEAQSKLRLVYLNDTCHLD